MKTLGDITVEDIKNRCDEVGDCWLWKQGTTSGGYPIMKVYGCGCQLVRRLSATLAGKPPAPRQPVDTICDERLCVNPEHMKPTTVSAIAKKAADKGAFSSASRGARIAASRRSGKVKLTDDQVAEIRASTEPETKLGAMYGVNRSYIGRIRRGTDRKDYSNPFAGLGAR